MKKNIIVGLLIFVLSALQSTVFAMQFSQPIQFGMVSTKDAKNFHSNTGTLSSSGQAFDYQVNGGIVRLYLMNHFYRFGSVDDDKNTVSAPVQGVLKLYQITSDQGLNFYALIGQDSGGGAMVSLVGQNSSGHFISYAKNETFKQYAHDTTGDKCELSVEGDTIVLTCNNWGGKEYQYLLKWNDNAQWFGIEYRP